MCNLRISALSYRFHCLDPCLLLHRFSLALSFSLTLFLSASQFGGRNSQLLGSRLSAQLDVRLDQDIIRRFAIFCCYTTAFPTNQQQQQSSHSSTKKIRQFVEHLALTLIAAPIKGLHLLYNRWRQLMHLHLHLNPFIKLANKTST